MIARADAARDLQIDHPVLNPGAGNELADFARHGERARIGSASRIPAADRARRSRCSASVNGSAVVDADHLVNAVGELKSAVFDADAGLGHGNDFTVDPD